MTLTRAGSLGAYCLAVAVVLAWACGGGGSTAGNGTDSSKVATATLPATLPQPKIIGSGAFQSGGGASYVVKSGDSWSAIAARFGLSLEELLAANSGIDTSQLLPGQVVRLPATDAAAAPTQRPPSTEPPATATVLPATSEPAATSSPPPPAATAPPSGPQTYTVQSGDVPETIAQKFGITTEALLAANPGVNPNNLHVGDVLTIPPRPPN